MRQREQKFHRRKRNSTKRRMMLEEINQLRLSKSDAANILDALNEWDETIGAKELGDDEVGLDYQRWVELKLRLTDFLENKNEFDPPP